MRSPASTSLDQRERGLQVGVVGDPHQHLQLPDAAVIVQDLPHDLAVRHHHARAVHVQQRRAEEGNGLDRALDACDGDVFAHPERLGEDDRQPGNHVAEHALGGERHAGAGDAEPGDQRQQLHAEVLQRHDDEEQEARRPGDAGEQQAHGGFELQALQQAAAASG